MSHDTAGADSHVVSDGHAGQDYRSAADPNAVTDFYRRRLRAAKSKFTSFRGRANRSRKSAGWNAV